MFKFKFELLQRVFFVDVDKNASSCIRAGEVLTRIFTEQYESNAVNSTRRAYKVMSGYTEFEISESDLYGSLLEIAEDLKNHSTFGTQAKFSRAI